MKITIWDLDYYYATERGQISNVDVQKISSYHKQKGDSVNFVTTERDIYRPYDIYYIIKENKKTPNPPKEFFINPKVRWWGEAFVSRQNWRMSDAMLACRPDYLLYPERTTKQARATKIQLLGNSGKLLPVTQDWQNTFTRKQNIVVDKKLWYVDKSVIIQALDKIKDVPQISFQEPIYWNIILNDKEIEKVFLSLHFNNLSSIKFTACAPENVRFLINWLEKTFKKQFPNAPIPTLELKYSSSPWKTMQDAQIGLHVLEDAIVDAKKLGYTLHIIAPRHREDTPFFFIPELIEDWSKTNFKMSWLEYISARFKVDKNYMSGTTDWNKPDKWHPLFRDVLRQTYKNTEFLLTQWYDTKININEIPWTLWEETFKYGL